MALESSTLYSPLECQYVCVALGYTGLEASTLGAIKSPWDRLSLEDRSWEKANVGYRNVADIWSWRSLKKTPLHRHQFNTNNKIS